MSRFSELVRLHRLSHNETQSEYAKRFGFESATAVSLWESGQRKIPESVMEEIVFENLPTYEICSFCGGSGVIKKVSL